MCIKEGVNRNMTDRRIVKSEKAIQSAFLAMLLDVGFDAITVKNLTEKPISAGRPFICIIWINMIF